MILGVSILKHIRIYNVVPHWLKSHSIVDKRCSTVLPEVARRSFD